MSNDYQTLQKTAEGQALSTATLEATKTARDDVSQAIQVAFIPTIVDEGERSVSEHNESCFESSSSEPQVNPPVPDTERGSTKSPPLQQAAFSDPSLIRNGIDSSLSGKTADRPISRSHSTSKDASWLAAIAHKEQVKLTRQVFLKGVGDPQIVVFCGTESGNGCSRVGTESAIALAGQTSGSVCLVDANLRSPMLHNLFGLANRKGFADVLCNQENIRKYSTLVDGLWIMTSGGHTSNATSLLTRDKLVPQMKELRKAFDFVLIDAPPLDRFADATSLAPLVDGVVLVLEANSTRKDVARKAVDDLRAAKAQILAAVLNKRRFPIPETIYRRI